MIHKYNKCEYRSPYKANYRRHLRNKHEEPKMIHYCAHGDYQTPYKSYEYSTFSSAKKASMILYQQLCLQYKKELFKGWIQSFSS